MLSIMFKDCCMKCGDVDVDYDYMEPISGDRAVCIYCSHMKVCKKFESGETDIRRKGQDEAE